MKNHLYRRIRFLFSFAVVSLLGMAIVWAADLGPLNRRADVADTRHNLSVTNAITATSGSSFGATVKATSETQICVFCHTPHGSKSGSTTFVAPLWNRNLSPDATYTQPYDSTSLDANPKPGVPGTGSKLCLSCHDGTLAIGTIGVLNGASDSTIAMQGTATDIVAAGGMPPGASGANSGFTRRIGVNLTNDHPISFTYNAALAEADGELYIPGDTGVAVAGRVRGQEKPQFPLIVPSNSTDRTSGQMECITCHDPHLKTDQQDLITGEPVNNKFLRGNRFQLVSPTPTSTGITAQYDPAKDIICLACHNKPTWATSTHANVEATKEKYLDSSADLRDFPRDISVWQASCANCHDMHTVPGARRLLREGIDNMASPKIGIDNGSTSAASVEQVCFQCHSPPADRVLAVEFPDEVPDVKTDFSRAVRMPIVTAEQGEVPVGGGSPIRTTDEEIHAIGTKPTLPADGSTDPALGGTGTYNQQRGKDFVETRTLMGANLKNRHAECTDCHQPHRVTRTELFNGDPTISSVKGTHRHAGVNDVGSVPHNNLASGSQRGQFGVEPQYSSNRFDAEPSSFIEKRGAVNTGADTSVSNTYLTREYQVCAKCHSNYSFGTDRPFLGRNPGGTPYGTNGMTVYTNIFREIQAPSAHQGNAVTNDSGAHKGMTPYDSGNNYSVDFTIKNRRSWHPVMRPTGRTPALRNADPANWLAPWDSVGEQTMYCTDCHGSQTEAGESTQPIDGAAEGPHGSDNIFLLKGWWDYCTGKTPTSTTNYQSGYPGSTTCLDDSTPSVPSNASRGVTRPDTSTTDNDLCFKCHSRDVYKDGTAGISGFSGDAALNGNGHGHRATNNARCMFCHIAVPHGWKNKAFLVNLNDVGPEAMCRQEDWEDAPVGYKCNGDNINPPTTPIPMPAGTQVRIPGLPQPGGNPDPNYWETRAYTNPPYYRRAVLKIVEFAASGQWQRNNCGSKGLPGSGATGIGWMRSTSDGEGCVGVP